MTTATEMPARQWTWLPASLQRIARSALVDLDRAAPKGRQAHGAWVSLLAANVIVAIGFALLVMGNAAPVMVAVWAGTATAVSTVQAVTILFQSRMPHTGFGRKQFHVPWAIMLGLVWAALPSLFFDIVLPEIRILIVGMTFAIASIGSLALATLPKAAIIFCSMITASLTLSSIKLGGGAGIALGTLSILYGLAMSGMILKAHDHAIQRARIDREVTKQNEIIALLLNDFSDDARDWLWETDSAGRITYASRGLADGLDVPAETLTGIAFEALAPSGADLSGWHELQTAFLRRKPIDAAEVQLPLAHGQCWWRMTARPMFDAMGVFQGYRGVAHDVTGDHHTNQRLAAEKEAAERSSATKSQFLAVMSHELRTPLNAIVGFAELLGSPQSENITFDDRAEHLRTILESSKHLQALISDILDASRIEKGTMKLVEQEVDAAELVEIAVKLCREAAEKTDTMMVAHIIDGIELQCDMTRIKQVLINLITNALKFSPRGGFVNVQLERTTSGGLSVAISDKGVGISKADIERIFEPYVQADEGTARRFGGAGLGLAIARRIAMLHGGNVTIESELGVGTTARLELPADRVTWPRSEATENNRAA